MTSSRSDRRIFVDTSAWFAAASRRDGDYPRASVTMRRLVLDRSRFVTTNFVLAELHALALARHAPAEALEMVTRIMDSPATSVVRVRSRDEVRAWQIVRQFGGKSFSFTDTLSFAVMERMELSRALMLDQHFAQFGLQAIELDAIERMS